MLDGLLARISRDGSVAYDVFVEHALYEPNHGFFATGHGAGRAGRDFITSPELGPSFAQCVGRALDAWWHELGQPDPFIVVEAGAGRGVLARDILRSEPACMRALRYVLVERSAALRDAARALVDLDDPVAVFGPGAMDEDGVMTAVPDTGPVVVACETVPALSAHVVFANELLDNLPFRIVSVEHASWVEVRIGVDAQGSLQEVTLPIGPELVNEVAHLGDARDWPNGTRFPIGTGIRMWLDSVVPHITRGVLALIDYAANTSELAARNGDWLRTYRNHERGSDPLIEPGSCDITIDVPIDLVQRVLEHRGFSVHTTKQAVWLQALGIEVIADTAAAVWREHAAIGGLEALRARSVVHEVDALTDRTGLGDFTVIEARRGHFARR